MPSDSRGSLFPASLQQNPTCGFSVVARVLLRKPGVQRGCSRLPTSGGSRTTRDFYFAYKLFSHVWTDRVKKTNARTGPLM